MRAIFVWITVAGAAGSAVACGSGDDSCATSSAVVAPDASTDGAANFDATTARGDAGAAGDASPTPVAFFRFANWSADAPTVDFCLAAHGTGAFGTPFLAAQAAAINAAGAVSAGPSALAFPVATSYLEVSPGLYDVRLVPAGSGDCSTKIVDDATNLAPLPADGFATIAILGANHPASNEPALHIAGFSDELTSSLAGSPPLIRGINADVDLPSIGLQATFGATTTPLLVGISTGLSSQGNPMADRFGYVTSPPFSTGTIGVSAAQADPALDAAAGSILVQAPNISIPAASITTFVVVGTNGGTAPDGGAGAILLLECIDNAGTIGLAGSCSIVGQK